VVLVAGFGAQMISWANGFCAGLAERGRHVVRFDNRDTGRSTTFDDHPVDLGELIAAASSGDVASVTAMAPYGLADLADDVAALIVVVAIIASGIALFRSTASELMDAQAASGLVKNIRQTALTEPGVHGVETLWVRKSGLEYFADIHIEVEPLMTVAEGHRIGHRVKDRLLSRFPELRDVLVHLEPHGDEQRG